MRVRISPSAFFQTNTEMAERLYRLAIEYAAPAASDRVYDLYCGIGTIGLLMAPRVARGVGARARRGGDRRRDRERQAERGRERPLLRRRRPPRAARAGRSAPAAPTCSSSTRPRSGLSQKVVRRVIEAGPTPDRLRVVQPDDARAERRPARRRRRLPAAPGAGGRHVPADAAHRVRGAAGTSRRGSGAVVAAVTDARRHDQRREAERRGPSRPDARAPARCSSASRPPG